MISTRGRAPVISLTFLQSPAVAGLISGILVALSNHILTRKKTAAEIEKLQAEASLSRAQAQQITDNLTNLSDKVGYKLPDVTEDRELTLYSSTNSDNFDFRLAKIDKADGELQVKDGLLSLRRANNLGTLQIWLESYRSGKDNQRTLAKNENISGDRKLRAACEVKAVGAEHTLLFILKGENTPSGVHMGEKRQRITSNEWTPMEAYFRVSPGQNCHFRIDDRSVSASSSTLQIRNLVLAERT